MSYDYKADVVKLWPGGSYVAFQAGWWLASDFMNPSVIQRGNTMACGDCQLPHPLQLSVWHVGESCLAPFTCGDEVHVYDCFLFLSSYRPCFCYFSNLS